MSNKKQQIFLIRHGQTAWSLSGQHTGTTDIPLLPEGEAQARALVPFLAKKQFHTIFCSPRTRAIETAHLCGLEDLEITQALVEWNYGQYEGLKTVEIQREKPTWNLFLDGAPGGESGKEIAARLDPLLHTIKEQGESVALVAHGHILRALAARWLGLPADHGRFLALSAGSLSILGWEHEADPVLKLWNFVP